MMEDYFALPFSLTKVLEGTPAARNKVYNFESEH
jgi:hypothetical protein